jgi:predicted PurR-regulated permease PerM
MLLDSELFQRKLRMIFGKRQAAATQDILSEINRQLKGFIVVKFSVAVGLGIVVTIGLLIFRVKYAYIWGPLVGFMNLIPYVGSIVSAIPPIVVAGIQHESIAYMVYVALFFLAIQFTEGNIVTPRLTSGSVDLNTLAVLLAAMYWGWLWGFIGIILAVPITAAIKVICDHVEPLKPIGTMLGTGRA